MDPSAAIVRRTGGIGFAISGAVMIGDLSIDSVMQ